MTDICAEVISGYMEFTLANWNLIFHLSEIFLTRLNSYWKRTNVLKMLYKINLVCYNQNCFWIGTEISKFESDKTSLVNNNFYLIVELFNMNLRG